MISELIWLTFLLKLIKRMRRINSEEFGKSNLQTLDEMALKRDTPLTQFLDTYEITTNTKDLTDNIGE